MRIAVCGLGKLGLPIAQAFGRSGVEVIGYDTDKKKLDTMDLLEFDTTTNPRIAARESEACLFVVPTPSNPDGSFNHDILLGAIRSIAEHAPLDYLYIINSTVMPGFCDTLPYHVAYKPEFVALGEVEYGLTHPDFLLIGAKHASIHEDVRNLYRKITLFSTPVKLLSLLEAEIAKISLNCAITAKISFANQVGMLADRLGANAEHILDVVGSDHRIGHACLKAGLPFGGPCFPRDNSMFRYVAGESGTSSAMCEATDKINGTVVEEIIRKVPKDGSVGILGMAYKVGTGVTEESAGTKLAKLLRELGRTVFTDDPTYVVREIERALECPTVIIACPWPEYAGLRFSKGTKVIAP